MAKAKKVKNVVVQQPMRNTEKIVTRRTAPVGVKIISILYYIGAVVMAIIGIIALIGGGMAATLFAENDALAAVAGAGAIIFALVLLIFAVLAFIIGRGLWNGRNWARVVTIVLSIIGAISALLAMIGGQFGSIIQLIVDVVIAWYLLANKEAKSFFA